MPLTVMQFWQQERDTYKTEQTVAQTNLSAAQSALASAKAALATDLKTFSDLGSKIQSARAQLATTAIPADVAALNLQIRDLIVQQRVAQGTVLDDQDAIDWAQADADAAAATLARATALLADAQSKLDTATTDDQQRQTMRGALVAVPFSTIQADANTASGALQTDADDAMNANFPAELLKIAGLRFARRRRVLGDRRNSIALAETAAGNQANNDSGKAGAAAKAAVAFRQAERNVRDYYGTARQRLTKAVGMLTALQAAKLQPATNPLLTAAQKAQLADATVLAARQTAESHAEPIDAARGDVETALLALDAQILTAIGADVDTAATDATVATKRAALTSSRGTLKADQDNFVAADKTTLDDWEAILPDPVWQTVLDYFDAKATVADLKTLKIVPAGDADSLIKILDDAETAYGDALAAAAKARRTTDFFGDQVSLRQDRYDAASAAYSGRALSAVRGDSF